MYITPVQTRIYTNLSLKSYPVYPAFRSSLVRDTFEKRDSIPLNLFNPFSDNYCKKDVTLDLAEPKVFEVENPMEGETPLIVDYDPSRTGSLINKSSGKPFSVNILKTTTENFANSFAYHFMSKDLKHEYGYVHLYRTGLEDAGDSDLTRDYEDIGVVGERLEVLYLRNFADSRIGGVGKLADKLAVRYCVDNGFEPNIVSYADTGSHVAHYKRGKRFIPPSKDTEEWEFLKNNYGKTDPNKVLEELIKQADKNNDFVDLCGWGYMITYMPKELSEKYR